MTSTVVVSHITSFNCISCSGLPLETAVGLFNSEVKTHLVIFANRGTKEYTELQDQLGPLAPEFTGKVSQGYIGIYMWKCPSDPCKFL